MPTLLLLLLASPRPRRQVHPHWLLHIPTNHLLRLQLQLLELLMWLVILPTLRLHNSIPNGLLNHKTSTTAPPWCPVLLLTALRPHTVIE
jgi:hypothetical protein